ncbi:muscarinic acetylcholine receptor M4-like [Poeciliopsis prolifica]|uniref:muscarinic acetylcholine receptor M4-like n=1 Tax=Poeciliopsis prolifica TaxID=188132 RepID=UPI0024138D50|nr:muscarinic acetylcholine receptor M4-like [Poeciliopsis prolifica]XP_054892181.1 muscarinic acetylcholine receptor M4-like [Poeciliopsis prolifica]XP_054892188.1 muscarinic acetylcholine receptor M4-like [Poeciliopsis prolifica]XP_054892195.1 muscarinic acetylcholine receptor M4-like [Poeciliopsis prolifica]XP_054892203.1 muscarinic acetylcholine receptor M4-like [Poeciliopsis prolifica]
METANASSIVNMTRGSRTSLFSESSYTVVEIVLILLAAGILSLITVTGNILVLLSIKVNKDLQTINNYFLFSLACADLFIGFLSMNLYAIYIVIDHWPLGEVECDIWLTTDYVVSNASVMNLLLISFDRYFCVTKPLTYPACRSTKMAGMMIATAWILSFVLWSPFILSWQFIVGRRSVLSTHCHFEFFYNPWLMFVASIIVFYLPLSIMAYLYWQIAKTNCDSVTRNVTRLSSGSLSDIVSFSLVEEKEESSAGKEKEMLQQHSEIGLLRELQADHRDSSSETIKASTSKETYMLRGSFSFSERKESLPTLERRRSINADRGKKVTRTIVAVMVAFIVTWTPYNMTVLVHALCNKCVPKAMWSILYWLCYVNSTVNPACYALCNDTFKITFKHLLLCQYKNIRGR